MAVKDLQMVLTLQEALLLMLSIDLDQRRA